MTDNNGSRPPDREQRFQTWVQGVILAITLGMGAAQISLMNSAAAQAEINKQTQKDIGVLQLGLETMRTQATAATLTAANATTAAALAAATSATDAALAASKAATLAATIAETRRK